MKLECPCQYDIHLRPASYRKDGPKMVNDDRDFPPLACLFLNEWPLLMPKRGRMRAGSALGWVTVLDCIVAHSLCYCTYCGIISLAGNARFPSICFLCRIHANMILMVFNFHTQLLRLRTTTMQMKKLTVAHGFFWHVVHVQKKYWLFFKVVQIWI